VVTEGWQKGWKGWKRAWYWKTVDGVGRYRMIGGVLENLVGMRGLEEWEKYWKE
jgi:hypothetical protein